MDFEEMRVIWDSQNQQPLYVFDQRALHATVRRKGRAIERSVHWFEIFMVAILLAVAGILVGKRLLFEPDYPGSLLVAAGLSLTVATLAALHLVLGRRRRLRRERAFDDTLLGDIEKAISRVDYQVARLKTFHLWFILPMALMTGLNVVMKGVSFPELFHYPRILIWPLFLLTIVIYYGAIWLEMRCFHRPRKQSLEALRDKLLDQG